MKKIAIAAVLALSALSAHAATAELVVNGNFETGTFAGWTKSGNPNLSDIISNTVTSNHTFVWRGGASDSLGYISQNLATTVGGAYSLSFDVYNTATTQSIFEADFNGVKVAGFSNEVHNWTHYTVNNLIASSALTQLKFGIQNNPSFTRLDNVSVTAVPEPETYAMMLAGLGLLSLIAKRRKAS